MKVIEAIHSKRAVRVYKDESLPVKTILHAGGGPSHRRIRSLGIS